MEKWLNEGRALHETKTECQFCGGLIPAELLSKLADHFSTEYDVLMNDLSRLEVDLARARAESLQLPQSGFFYPDLLPSFERTANKIEQLLTDRRASLDKLTDAVAEKKTKAFTPFSGPQVSDDANGIEASLADLSALITEHNKRSQQFDQNRESAFGELEAHWASRFVVDQDYAAKVNRVATLKTEAADKSTQRDELTEEIKSLERELSEAVKGAETLNDLIRAYFGKDDLRVTVSEDDRFYITRSGSVAKNLSEGERSAIAFVHFMTRLLDENHPLAETTVVIDDPIGSLDANHLFNTYSLLKTKLSGCYQLFVLTHSYEFYSLLKEWALSVKGNEADKPQTTWKKWSVYLVRRKDNGTSAIEVIPPELLKFKSEYHYLFATLHKFRNTTELHYDQLFSLPNVTRRFMEAFGGVMIPTYQGLYSKLPRLIPDEVQRERVWKFVNEFSHNTSMNRSLAIPDASECKVVVATCLDAVEQWNAAYFRDLVEAVQ